MIAILAGKILNVWQMERWGHHPNHSAGESIEGNRFSQDPWVALKLVSPKAVHQDRDMLVARLGLLWRECPAKQRRGRA